MSSKQRPHCLFFFLSSCPSDWMSTFGVSWKMCCGVFSAGRWDQRVPPPVRQVYSLMTHSSASFNGKHNFGFLRREKKILASWARRTKILGRNMTFIPFANVSVFPYMTKILLLKFIHTLWLLIHIFICTHSNDYKLARKINPMYKA